MVLINRDMLEVMKEIPDNTIDLIVTDPPYRVTSRGNAGTSGGMMTKKQRGNKMKEIRERLLQDLKEFKAELTYGVNTRKLIELEKTINELLENYIIVARDDLKTFIQKEEHIDGEGNIRLIYKLERSVTLNIDKETIEEVDDIQNIKDLMEEVAYEEFERALENLESNLK